MSKNLIIGAALIIVAVIGFFLYSSTETPIPTNTNEDSSNTSAGMRAEENMVVVSEQRPGISITGSLIVLAAPGYLVIHEDKDGAPGAILGASALLAAGENSTVQVRLSRSTRDGETLHAMLHFEKGDNVTFAASEDTPIQSRLGGSISGWFLISSEAPLDVPISI